MFYVSPVAQSISLSPETLNALRDMGIAIIAIVCITIVVWRLLGVVDRNTKVLDKIGERNANYQDSSLKEKEKTREWITTAGNSVVDMTKALTEMQKNLGMAIEGTTDALKGKDGVLEVLRSSALQLTGLTTKTQSVVETAQNIIDSLEQVKTTMSSADGEMKKQIEAIQSQLSTLATTVQIIPEAVTKAEENIIAAINKQPTAPAIPPPVVDETIPTKPPVNGLGKEPENVTPSQT